MDFLTLEKKVLGINQFHCILTCVCQEVELALLVMFNPILVACLQHFLCTL